MSHFLLPQCSPSRVGDTLDGRYGDEAVELILNDLRALGISPSQCQGQAPIVVYAYCHPV